MLNEAKTSRPGQGQSFEAEARATRPSQDYEIETEAKNNYEKVPNYD